MTTVTIPKKVTGREELIVLPRKEYEKLLRVYKKSVAQKLDKDLQKALAEIKAGKVSGLFDNVKDLMRALES